MKKKIKKGFEQSIIEKMVLQQKLKLRLSLLWQYLNDCERGTCPASTKVHVQTAFLLKWNKKKLKHRVREINTSTADSTAKIIQQETNINYWQN